MRDYVSLKNPALFISAFSALVILLLFPVVLIADNAVDIGMTCWGQHDTIYAGKVTSFDIYIENDVGWYGISLGNRIWSPDGATWSYDTGPCLYSGAVGHDQVCISLEYDSRMNDGSIWDMAGPLLDEANVDGIDDDTIMFGGVAMMEGLPPGPMEHMYSYLLIAEISDPGGDYNLCIDSCFLPPSGAFIFVDIMGTAFFPTTLWESGGACWPVKAFPYICGDVNGDGQFNVGDPIFLIAFIFKGGPEPPNFRLGDANGDGTVDVGDAVYMLANIFQHGPDPICP